MASTASRSGALRSPVLSGPAEAIAGAVRRWAGACPGARSSAGEGRVRASSGLPAGDAARGRGVAGRAAGSKPPRNTAEKTASNTGSCSRADTSTTRDAQ